MNQAVVYQRPLIIHGFTLDIEKLRSIAATLQPLIDTIEADRASTPLDAETELRQWLRIRMERYRERLGMEFRVKTEAEINQAFETTLAGIFAACQPLLHKQGEISWDDLHSVHTSLYPKGLWGQARNAQGEEKFLRFPSGKFRQHDEFIKGNEGDSYFIPPSDIADALSQFGRLLGEEWADVHFLLRLTVYLAGANQAHPYYNGNGTLLYCYMGLLLLRRGYPIPHAADQYFNHPRIGSDLNNCRLGNYELACRTFLKSFIVTRHGKF